MRVGALLFCSGFSALIYQTVWLRQFRTIFGASTFATGAVLAIFMAGLGLGSAVLGKRADASSRPLAFYARLELLIALSAALSPVLLFFAARTYFASGGSPNLGTAGATLLRLVLAAIVIGPATFLMGGTLPAAARSVETREDARRGAVAVLYGMNALGAVAGTLLSTFVLLEMVGNRKTLLGAALLNALVGLAAGLMSRNFTAAPAEDVERSESAGPALPRAAIYGASAATGFAFLLMELVWYRMLSPLLGGTTYMFGLILAVALLGIGFGGLTYSLIRGSAPTAGQFAATSALEALAMAIPFALGDRLAIACNVLRGWSILGFGGMVASWTLVTLVVVFPAAFLAGIQFPLLIALLGRGRERVGRHVGAAYAWNTLGAIAGSLAGAFGLLPLLSAPDCWRLVAGLLCGLGAMSLLASLRHRGSWALAVATAVSLCFAVSCLSGPGPTAIWRHSGIGGGRAAEVRTPNGIKKWMNNWRREMVVDRDGRESSVGIVRGNDTALLVNGKSDGSARGDAGTQVGCGLVGAVLHPHPRSSIVVGLGTGTTAGWLARVPTMERVDVVELERVIVDAAHLYDDVNERAMSNPKVRTIVGDGREVLLMRGRKYDLIASEPSNPYRAGVASLFTREFYELASQRLADDGLFMQWMQLYSIHPKTAQTVYATITSVFPYVQTWSTASSDVILVASKKPIVVDVAQLRRRIASEPYRSAFFNVWRVDSAEGFLGRLIANETYATNAASRGGLQNTDDRTVIEFGFSRNIETSFSSVRQLITSEATRINALVPRVMRGSVDGPLLEASRFYLPAWWSTNEGAQALAALALAEQGNGEAEARANTLAARQPIEAAVIRGVLRMKLGFVDDATARFDDALRAYRLDPWPQKAVMDKAIEYALQAGLTSGERARVLYEAMEKPFAAGLMNRYRLYALQLLAAKFDPCGPRTIAALRVVEPNPFWNRESLVIRADCYARAGLTELGARASADLREFDASETEAIADSDR